MSRRARVAVEAVVSVVLLAVLLWLAHPAKIWEILSHTRLHWFLLGLAVTVATVPMMAWRWQLLLSAKKLHAPLSWLTRTYFVALFAGQFLPAAIGGDAVRAVELGRRSHDAPEAVASVLIDRLVGVVSLVALALLAFAAGGHSAGGVEVIVAEAVFGLAAVVILALLFSSGLRGLAARTLEPRIEGRQLAAGQRFYDALHAYREHRATLAAVCALAVVVQALRIGTIWMLVKALDLHVSIESVFATGPVLFAALILPVSLNGIGVREAVFVYFLRDSTTPAQAVALGVAFFVLGSATALIGALVLIWRFARYGMGAVRPRKRIEDDQLEPLQPPADTPGR
ncbi:MAG: lysylphosphatidylglycerol synthase transmembrane domain-containing protein [Gaiellales bacterium]